MPIASITIENFKNIGDKAVTIPIRPITLLFGKNSSGKSTVLQALRYFAEIMNRWPNLGRIEMSGGLNTDLDDFHSLVHRHELDRKIRIRWTMVDDAIQTTEWHEVITGCQEGNPRFYWSFSIGLVLEKKEEICLRLSPRWETSADAVIGSNGEEWIFWKEIEIEDEIEDVVGKIYVNTTDLSNQAKKVINAWIDLSLNPQESKTKELVDNSILGPKRFIMRHLGPFREVPPREYEIPQTPDESRWQKGLGAWDALARDPKLVEKTNHYLKEVLQLGYTIKREESDQNFQLHDENNDIDVGLSDVGVGIAQVIPVVVGVLDGSFNTFAVEQPELHVHPAVQVALGDVFIDSAKSREQDIEEFYQKLDKALLVNESIKEINESIKKIEELNKKIEKLNEKSEKIETSENKELIDKLKDAMADLDKPLPALSSENKELIDELKDRKERIDLLFNENPKIKEHIEFLDLMKDIKKDPMFIFDHLSKENPNPKLLEFINAIESSNRIMLIETHSEHLLLRLLRRVRETTEGEQTEYPLTPDDLSVIYVRSTSEGVEFTPISVTEDGDFEVLWPEGFFDERVEEIF